MLEAVDASPLLGTNSSTVHRSLPRCLALQLDMEAVYRRDGGAPLRQLQAALANAEAEAQAAAQDQAPGPAPAPEEVGHQGAPGPVDDALAAPGKSLPPPAGGGGGGSTVADVAALQAALGGVVWTKSMSRM
jgi:hypothetical protein